MFRMTRERSTRTLTLIFVAAAALAFLLNAGHYAPAQRPREGALLVTSLGPADTPAPDILPEIFRANVDGSGRKPLLAKKTVAFDPALSPDGKWIAFVGSTGVDPREEDKGTLALFVMSAHSTGSKRLAENKGAAEHLLAPSWSPDGKRIAFCTFVFGFRGNGTTFHSAPQIHLIDPDGQNRKRLEKADGLNPVWSPDGKRLLFTRLEEESEGTSLWAIDVDGTNPRQLVKQEGKGDTIMGADWSPDGKSLVYAFFF
jgi:Tol biopolymer transport system component